jgi:hypothetical protein
MWGFFFKKFSGYNSLLLLWINKNIITQIQFSILDAMWNAPGEDWTVRLVHILREENAYADYLIKIEAHNLDAYSPLAVPPDERVSSR